MNSKEKYQFIDDTLYVLTPAYHLNENAYKSQAIIDKKTFQECFYKWIIGEGIDAKGGESDD